MTRLVSASSCVPGFHFDSWNVRTTARKKPSSSLTETIFAALDAFDQNLDVAVGQLQALDDVRDRSDADRFRPAAARRRDASCCVARKIFLSPASASSSARTLDSRPTTNGVIMYGKMTTSRMGIIGNRLVSDFSFEVSM